MTLSQILLVLKARWRSASLVLLLVLAGVATMTALQQPQYTAAASVLLDVKSSDPIAGSAMQALAISGYMVTQADVLVSQRVVVGALRQLRLHEVPATVAAWRAASGGRGDMLAWLYEQHARRLQVLPSRESNVINVSYSDTDPEAAAAVVNALVQSYIATTIELRAEPARQYNAFFDQRARELRQELERAQARLSDFQRDAGIMVTDERMDVENTRLADVATQLVVAQAAATEADSRRRLGAGDPQVSSEVLASPLIATLTADLTRQRAKLGELRTRLGEANPEVQTVRAGVEELQGRLDAEIAKVQSNLAMNNTVYTQKTAQLRNDYETLRSRVLRLKSQRDQAAVLQRDVDNANLAYSAAYTRVGQANLESQATQTNVSLLQVAAVPTSPSKPRVAVNMGLALVVGVLLAAAQAIVRELRDPRLRDLDDVATLLQTPLFGVLPAGEGSARRGLGALAAVKRLLAPQRAVSGP